MPPTCESPCTIWKVPFGAPAASSAAAIASPTTVVPYGAHSLGLMIDGAPTARELASLWQPCGGGRVPRHQAQRRAPRQTVHLDRLAGRAVDDALEPALAQQVRREAERAAVDHRGEHAGGADDGARCRTTRARRRASPRRRARRRRSRGSRARSIGGDRAPRAGLVHRASAAAAARSTSSSEVPTHAARPSRRCSGSRGRSPRSTGAHGPLPVDQLAWWQGSRRTATACGHEFSSSGVDPGDSSAVVHGPARPRADRARPGRWGRR